MLERAREDFSCINSQIVAGAHRYLCRPLVMSGFPTPHVIPPLALHTHTIILLHGRGSNGPEFAEELLEARTSNGLSLQEHLPGWKWVFPTSQTRFSTLFREDISE